MRCVCYKNDIHRRDSLRHRRVCLRVMRARATVSWACGRDRHRHSAAAPPPSPSSSPPTLSPSPPNVPPPPSRQGPTENRFEPKATPCVDRTPVGHAAPSDTVARCYVKLLLVVCLTFSLGAYKSSYNRSNTVIAPSSHAKATTFLLFLVVTTFELDFAMTSL